MPKTTDHIMNTTRIFRSLIKSLPVLVALVLCIGTTRAQTEKDSTVSEAGATSIELIYRKTNNQARKLSATVKTKVEGNYMGVKGLAVNFYHTELDQANLLGSAITDGKGAVQLTVPEDRMKGVATEATFIAAIEHAENYEDNQEEITVTNADFNMTLEEADSVRQVIVTLQAVNEAGELMPIADAEVHLYVQRMFGLLPLSADPETTDENGEVAVEFPAGIPGDTAGNLVIVAQVEDHELFGNLTFSRKINWGTPLVIDLTKSKRQLWASRANAPLYLIFMINTMLIGIWGVIAYIVYQVFLIRKIGRQPVDGSKSPA